MNYFIPITVVCCILAVKIIEYSVVNCCGCHVVISRGEDITHSPSSQFADAGIHDCTDVESEDQHGRYSPESSVVSDLDMAAVGA